MRILTFFVALSLLLAGCGGGFGLLMGLIGGLIGSLLLVLLPSETFKSLVPWLILTAALRFALQRVQVCQ